METGGEIRLKVTMTGGRALLLAVPRPTARIRALPGSDPVSTSTLPVGYPVHVNGDLDPNLSRGLWLVKWILAVPHYIVLAFLWVAFAVTTVAAFFSILATGRYPRPLFDFNVGVMRWSWRVAYYAYGALGTDRYPPFTLAEAADYPAHLDVDYPQHLSRGLVLVKWWLLAIPHYLVVVLFVGGAGYGVRGAGEDPILSLGLIGVLALVAGVVLLVTGRYPREVFDLLLGLNRWVLRVAGYVSLMTDRYPPFALDQGGHDPADGTGPRPARGPTTSAPATSETDARGAWTAGRVATLVAGALLVVAGLGLAGTGGALVVAHQTHRDADGFLMGTAESVSTDGFAITSQNLQIHLAGTPAWLPDDIVGDVRIEADPGTRGDVFVGIAPAADAAAYLSSVRHDTLVEVRDGEAVYRSTTGGAPTSPPAEQTFWTAQAAGDGPVLTWHPEKGDWTVVVMSTDGSAPVSAEVRAGAEVPVLETVIAVLLALGGGVLLLGFLCIAIPVRRASRGGAVSA